MKIAISCHPTQGGSGVVATELALSLAERGHEMHLVANEMPFRFKEDQGVVFHRVNVPHYPLFKYPPHDLSLANKLAQVTKDYGIEIIHSHYAVPHAVTALLAKQIVNPQPVRIVTTLHGTDITLVGSQKEFFDLTRHAIQSSDAVTSVSAWLGEQSALRFTLDAMPEVIPNFVDGRRFHARDRAAYPDGGGEFLLVHASNLRPVKRISHIVRVFNEVQKHLPARLLVLGNGPEKGMAQELAAQLGISNRVSFDGMSTDMETRLRSAHLYLLLSDYESFGLSALEAMACGVPVAVSDAGGLREVVDQNESGLLFPVPNDEYIGREIANLLGDKNRWEAMSAKAATAAHGRFGIDIIVPHYERLYKKTIEKQEQI